MCALVNAATHVAAKGILKPQFIDFSRPSQTTNVDKSLQLFYVVKVNLLQPDQVKVENRIVVDNDNIYYRWYIIVYIIVGR